MPTPPSPEDNGLIIRPSTSLVSLSDGRSPVLTEIIGRSLVHIQTSKTLGTLHKIGEHQLHSPDYRLVCAWAEELGIAPVDVLGHLLEVHAPSQWQTEIVENRFENILVKRDTLAIQAIPYVDGLILKKLCILGMGSRGTLELNLSAFPHLTELICPGNQLHKSF